jgi:hypothetical protein
VQSLAHVLMYRRVLAMVADGASTQDVADAFGRRDRRAGWDLQKKARRWLVWVTGPTEDVPPRQDPDPAVIAWAAGFFDGEGCVTGYEGLQGGRWRRFSFGVQVAQVRREPLDLLQATWGGSIRAVQTRRPEHQDQFIWTIRGQPGARFLTDILPHLRVKTVAAQAAIPCLFRIHKHGVAFTEDEVAGRRAAIAIIRAANRRGKAVA